MLTDLLILQAGKETTWGSAVTPTAKLMGIENARPRPVVKSEALAQVYGSLAPSQIVALTQVEGAADVDGVCLYEDLCYWQESLFGVATPTGAGPYTRDYAAPLASVPTSPRIMTLMYGDTGNAYQLAGGMVRSLTITGETGKASRFKTALIGKQVSVGSLAALSDRAVNAVMGDHHTIYVDAWAGTIGTTAIANTGFAYELALTAPRNLNRHFSLTPDGVIERRLAGTLKLTLEYNATSNAHLNSLLAASGPLQLQVRIKATVGAGASLKTMQLDFAGSALESPDLFSDRNGLVTFDLVLTGTYHSTLANWFKSQMVNGLSALP